MSGQLLPPPGSVPKLGVFPPDATPEYCVAAWIDLMRAGDKLLRAGLRMEVGPDGDLEAAYRQWYSDRCDEHTKHLVRMLTELSHREACHAGDSPPTIP